MMRETMLSMAAVCMIAAMCEQLMDNSRFFRCVRMVLGLEIVAAFASIIAESGVV